jgi:hypothetical protein
MVAHRVSSKRWMAALDNQLKSSVVPTGLATFAPSASGEAPWDNWRQWPHVTISLDLGSDGLSGYMALERKFKLNCDKIPDASHAANRDMILSLQQAGLYSLWLCLLINNNLPFGPNRDSHRYQELRECLASILTRMSPDSCPLFQYMLLDLQRCFERNNFTFDTESSVSVQVWKALQSRQSFVKEGYRATMNRFQACTSVGEKARKWWEVELFERTACALEQDYLKGRKLTGLVMLRPAEAEIVPEGGGAPRIPTGSPWRIAWIGTHFAMPARMRWRFLFWFWVTD